MKPARRPVSRPRRTQHERSALTQRRLLDAALECLVESGYAGTTTVAVAARAGVSRGAQLHHYPTRASLVASAVRHLFSEMTADYRRRFAALGSSRPTLGAAVRLLWDAYRDPRYGAVLELHVAARTDPELRRALRQVAAEHRHNVEMLARLYFPEAAQHPQFEPLLALVLDAMTGMAVSRIVHGDAGIAPERQLALLTEEAERLLGISLPASRPAREARPSHGTARRKTSRPRKELQRRRSD